MQTVILIAYIVLGICAAFASLEALRAAKRGNLPLTIYWCAAWIAFLMVLTCRA